MKFHQNLLQCVFLQTMMIVSVSWDLDFGVTTDKVRIIRLYFFSFKNLLNKNSAEK